MPKLQNRYLKKYQCSLDDFIEKCNRNLNRLSNCLSESNAQSAYNFNLRKELIDKTNWMDSNSLMKDRIYCYINNITEYKKCPICNSDIKNPRRSMCGNKECYSIAIAKRNASRIVKEESKQKYKNSMKKYFDDDKWVEKRKINQNKYRENVDKKLLKDISAKAHQNAKNNFINSYNSINEIFSKNETRELLINSDYNYTKYFGKTNYRKLIRDNLKLYKSIIENTKEFEHFMTRKSITERLLIIVQCNYDISNNLCHCGRKLLFDPTSQKLKNFGFCKKCYNVNEYMMQHYSKLYNIEDGEEAYSKFLQDRMEKTQNTLIKNTNRNICVSKVSQVFFSNLVSKLTTDFKYYFNDNGGEYKIFLTKSERSQFKNIGITRHCIFCDFFVHNCIIEFDGYYWHRNTEALDKLKDKIFIERGYNILRIKEMDFYKNPEKCINCAINFLNTHGIN